MEAIRDTKERAPLPKMPADIFDALLARTVCDTGHCTETIGLVADHGPWHISFYGCGEGSYALVLEDFGREADGDWRQMAPTARQLWEMQRALTARARLNRALAEEGERMRGEAERDAEGWEDTKDFINANFYNIY